MTAPVLDIAVTLELDGLSVTLRARPSAEAYRRLCSAETPELPAAILPPDDAEEILTCSLARAIETVRPELVRIRADLLAAQLAFLRDEEGQRTPGRRARRRS